MRIALTRRLAITAAAVLGVSAAVGVATAAVPGGDGAIKGCYATSNGLLGLTYTKGDTRIVDETEVCRSYEKAISWSQKGPKGDTGATGATGEACLPSVPGCVGPQGEPGPPGKDGQTGKDGPQGPQGQQGIPGPSGPAGVSAAYTASRREAVNVTGGQEVVARSLPAGLYVLSAKVSISNQDSDAQTTACSLNTASGSIDTSLGRPTGAVGGGREQTLALQGTATNPGVMRLECQGFRTSASFAEMTAVRVGAINP